ELDPPSGWQLMEKSGIRYKRLVSEVYAKHNECPRRSSALNLCAWCPCP
ncbi:22995_t:CDS:2, partial [Dentiscutata erythropus]